MPVIISTVLALALAGSSLESVEAFMSRPIGGFALPRTSVVKLRMGTVPLPCKPSQVIVEADAGAVAAAVRERLEAAATAAIRERGHFSLAIPGGSVLEMLKGTEPSWACKTTLAFVNHKTVANDDEALSTTAKAQRLFLEQWTGVDIVALGGTSDAVSEASKYQAKLQSIPVEHLPRDTNGDLPTFDLMLIGVGDDGHIGSLYPGSQEVLDTTGRWVLPVERKTPASITLSLPVICAAREVVVAACGVSAKYPQGKGVAMARAIEEEETVASFPAVALRASASWILDIAAASKLSFDYAECFNFRGNRGDCCPP